MQRMLAADSLNLHGQTLQEVHEPVNGFVPQTNDDWVLQCCLYYRVHARTTHDRVLLLSNDINLCNKAVINGVTAVERAGFPQNTTQLGELFLRCDSRELPPVLGHGHQYGVATSQRPTPQAHPSPKMKRPPTYHPRPANALSLDPDLDAIRREAEAEAASRSPLQKRKAGSRTASPRPASRCAASPRPESPRRSQTSSPAPLSTKKGVNEFCMCSLLPNLHPPHLAGQLPPGYSNTAFSSMELE
eukprot:m.279360 g.279360  ORF g.279360 m.279360 type:complete len:245 (+) comp11103_c6_seq7:632-1366(+)